MTKEEYKETEEILNKKISEIKEEIQIAKEKYIESNAPFKIGDKIKNQKDEIGVIYGFKMDYKKDIEILAKKLKKDGTASMIEFRVWWNDVITLAE